MLNIENSRGLFLSTSSSLGGAERVLIDLLDPWIKGDLHPKPEVGVIELGPLIGILRENKLETHLIEAHRKILEIGDSPSRKEKRLWQICKMVTTIPEIFSFIKKWKVFISEKAPAWIHSTGIKTHLLSALAAPPSTPVYWHIHDFIGQRQLVRKLLVFFWRPGISALAISDAVANDFRKNVPKCPVKVWKNTVDTFKFKPGVCDSGQLDRAAGLDPEWNGLRIGMVATYARWKGQDVFLRAASAICKKYQTVRFYIVGGPIYKTSGSQWEKNELVGMIEELGISEYVGLIPFQNDTARIFNSLDIVVHASTSPEPFGLVVAEGMACGKPVVAVLDGGAAEIGSHGIDCLGFSSGSSEDLAATLMMLIRDSEKRSKLGLAGRQKILKEFDGKLILPRWKDFLRDLGIAL